MTPIRRMAKLVAHGPTFDCAYNAVVTQEAQTLSCPQCGGRVPFGAPQCGFCGVALRFDRPAHQREVAQADAERALLQKEAVARRWAVMHARAARYNGVIVVLVVVFAVLLTWWFVAGVSGIAAKVPPVVTIPLVLVSAVVNLALGLTWARVMEQPSDLELGSVAMATCSGCGGVMPFDQGTAGGTCAYCGAHGLKTAEAAKAMLAQGHANLAVGRRDEAMAAQANVDTAANIDVRGVRLGPGGVMAIVFMGVAAITGALVFALVSDGATYATWWIWFVVVGSVVAMITLVVRGVKASIAAKEAFERRFGVKLHAQMYQPPPQ